MEVWPFKEHLQSSDFRNKYSYFIRVRLFSIILVMLSAYFLFSFGLLQNLKLILSVLTVAFIFNLIAPLTVNSHRTGIVFFLLAILLDVFALTVLVVSASEGRTPLLTLYILYVLAMGLFYGFRISLLPAIAGIIFFIICSIWLTPNSPLALVNIYSLFVDTTWLIILLTTVSLISVNHARSVWDKERTLSQREAELSAMQNISSATRMMLPIEGVIRLILTELIYGLHFDFGFLLLLDQKTQQIRLYHEHSGKNDDLIDRVLGFPFSSTFLPASQVSDSFFRAIRRKRTILHYRFSELVSGFEPKISLEQARRFQELSHLKFFIGVPMIANQQVIGALLAATQKEDLPKAQIVSFQKYANQAGLAIESAQRFEEIDFEGKL